jgi:DNA mismatch repair protein MutS
MNDEVLQSKTNNFLASVYFSNKKILVCRCVYRRILTAQGNAEYIDKLLQNFDPSEVLFKE